MEPNLSQDYLTVGQAAKKMGVTVRTLQYYDKAGLLPPSAVSEGGRRLYTHKDLVQLLEQHSGRAVGLSTLASAVGEDPGTLEDVYEPYLLQCGLIVRTPQGRVATHAAFEHLGIEPPTT